MRKLTVLFALLGLAATLAPVRAATPDSGTVQPPAGKAKKGPELTWAGKMFVAGSDSTAADCSSALPAPAANQTPPDACDEFHLTVPVKPSYWKGKGGGVFVGIDGYDENQDFDMYIYHAAADGTRGKLAAQSAGGKGVLEKTTIEAASGDYLVDVVAFSVTNSGYNGHAYFSIEPLHLVPPHVAIPGLPNSRASKDVYESHSEPTIAMNPLNHKNLIAGSKMYWTPLKYRFQIGTYFSMDGGLTWHDNGQLPGYPWDDHNYITSDISMTFDNAGNAYAFVLDSGSGSGDVGMSVSISRDGGRTWGLPHAVHRNSLGLPESACIPVVPDPVGTPRSCRAYIEDADQGLFGLFDDKNWIASDPSVAKGTVGTLYTCWNFDTFNPAGENDVIVASNSTDGGETWSPAFPLSTVPNGSMIGCQVVVSPVDGTAYVFWMDYGGYTAPGEKEGAGDGRRRAPPALPTVPPRIMMSKSTNHGLTWSSGTQIAAVDPAPGHLPGSKFRNPIFPSAGIGPDGKVSVVWGDYRTKDEDILFIQSTDQGGTWTDPVRVNDDPVGDHKDQFQPWLAVTPKGQLDVFFFDRRNDPKNYFIDVYVARSNDGVRFKNIRVTDEMWDPGINAPLNGGFIGDYQGIVADDAAAIPFWNDTRTGKWQEVYSARVPNTGVYRAPR